MLFIFLISVFIGNSFVWAAATAHAPLLKPKGNTEDGIFLCGTMFLRARIADFLYHYQVNGIHPERSYQEAVLKVFSDLDFFLSKPKMMESFADLTFDLPGLLTLIAGDNDDKNGILQSNKDLSYFFDKTFQISSDYAMYLVGEYFFPQQFICQSNKKAGNDEQPPRDEKLFIIVIEHFYKHFIARIQIREWSTLKNQFKHVVALGRQRLDRNRKRRFVLWSVSTSLIIWTVSLIIFKLKK